MADFFSSLSSLFSKGRVPGTTKASTAVALGLGVAIGPPVPIPAPRDKKQTMSKKQAQQQASAAGVAQLNDIIKTSTIDVLDVNGRKFNPLNTVGFDIGSGRTLQFDQATLDGRITPAFATDALDVIYSDTNGAAFSYTGTDCRVMIEVADDTAGTQRMAKQLLELTTISVSVHRVKSSANAAGYIGSKGFARGRRTIAGTMVMTKFTVEVLMRFLQSHVIKDKSKDTRYMKIDQLPPFNLSLVFCNEHGWASYQRLLGLEFVTSSDVYSIQDMLSEQSIAYVAADFTPLLPLNLSSLYKLQDRTTQPERTVRDILKRA